MSTAGIPNLHLPAVELKMFFSRVTFYSEISRRKQFLQATSLSLLLLSAAENPWGKLGSCLSPSLPALLHRKLAEQIQDMKPTLILHADPSLGAYVSQLGQSSLILSFFLLRIHTLLVFTSFLWLLFPHNSFFDLPTTLSNVYGLPFFKNYYCYIFINTPRSSSRDGTLWDFPTHFGMPTGVVIS